MLFEKHINRKPQHRLMQGRPSIRYCQINASDALGRFYFRYFISYQNSNQIISQLFEGDLVVVILFPDIPDVIDCRAITLLVIRDIPDDRVKCDA